jgi:hypothetical protein
MSRTKWAAAPRCLPGPSASQACLNARTPAEKARLTVAASDFRYLGHASKVETGGLHSARFHRSIFGTLARLLRYMTTVEVA